MYQFDSPYDHEVPHMYPQVKHIFFLTARERFDIPPLRKYNVWIYFWQLSSRSAYLERKSCSPAERNRGQGENLSLDSQGNETQRFVYETRITFLLFSGGWENVLIKRNLLRFIFLY